MTKAMIIETIVSMDESISKRELNRKRKDELLDIMLQMEQDHDSQDEEAEVQELSGWEKRLQDNKFVEIFNKTLKSYKPFIDRISKKPLLRNGHKCYTEYAVLSMAKDAIKEYDKCPVTNAGAKAFLNVLFEKGYLKHFRHNVEFCSCGTPASYHLFYFG